MVVAVSLCAVGEPHRTTPAPSIVKLAEIDQWFVKPCCKLRHPADPGSWQDGFNSVPRSDEIGREDIGLAPVPVDEHARIIPRERDVVDMYDDPWFESRQHIDHKDGDVTVHEHSVGTVQE